MSLRQMLVPAICAVTFCAAHAQIDSGGGIAVLSGGLNHSTIGGPTTTGAYATGLIEILYPSAPILKSAEDTDGNGLPDSWEVAHFGAKGVESLSDSDGDGNTNLMEFLAGTNPRSGDSVFRPTSHAVGRNLVLTVPTAMDRGYRIWGTHDLEGGWTLHDTIVGDGSTIEWIYPLHQSPRYFLKIQILIP